MCGIEAARKMRPRSQGGQTTKCTADMAQVQLEREKLERVKGIEPSYAAWEAAVLPLNYTRNRPRILVEGLSLGNP